MPKKATAWVPNDFYRYESMEAIFGWKDLTNLIVFGRAKRSSLMDTYVGEKCNDGNIIYFIEILEHLKNKRPVDLFVYFHKIYFFVKSMDIFQFIA